MAGTGSASLLERRNSYSSITAAMPTRETGKRFLDPDDSCAKAHAYRVGHGDVGWERHGDFNLCPLGEGVIQVEEYSPGAYVLRFGGNRFLGNARQFYGARAGACRRA